MPSHVYFHCLFISVFVFLHPVSPSPFVPMQVHPRGPVWLLSLLRRAGASRSMLSSAFLFGPCEPKEEHGTSFLSLSSLCLQHFSSSWEQSQELQSVHCPGRPLTIVPASVTLGSQAVASTLVSISGLQCFSLMFPAALNSDTVQLLLSEGKIFMAFYIWNSRCGQD